MRGPLCVTVMVSGLHLYGTFLVILITQSPSQYKSAFIHTLSGGSDFLSGFHLLIRSGNHRFTLEQFGIKYLDQGHVGALCDVITIRVSPWHHHHAHSNQIRRDWYCVLLLPCKDAKCGL